MPAPRRSTGRRGYVPEGDLRLGDIEILTNAEDARAILSSKLFTSIGAGRAVPLHRVIAEFLGARWLVQRAKTPRSRRRLLAQLHGTDGVPASLRGLHAWIAHHSPAMAREVIDADPFGVLRYGDVSEPQADHMFRALSRLAEADPRFRAADWSASAARSLMVPRMRSTIEAAISSPQAHGFQMRLLLLEGLHGTALAADLGAALDIVMRSPDQTFAERRAAAAALLPHRNRPWWRATIGQLSGQGGEDAPRLACDLIERIDYDVPLDVLVAALFAELGVTIDPRPGPQRGWRHTSRFYPPMIEAIPSAHLAEMLDRVTAYAVHVPADHLEGRRAVDGTMAPLLLRAIDEGAIGPEHGAALWRWLDLISMYGTVAREVEEQIAQRLHDRHDLRHAVQDHAFLDKTRAEAFWEAAETARAESERAERMERRHAFECARDALRAGSFQWIFDPARQYLGIKSGSLDKTPIERLVADLGEDLLCDVLAGFEAVLHHADLPPMERHVELAVSGEVYHIRYPLLAGLNERVRTGRGIADLPAATKAAGLLIVYEMHSGERWAALRAALEAEVIPTAEEQARFATAWIEPYLAAGPTTEATSTGLSQLAHDPEWQATGAKLAPDWLIRFPDLPLRAVRHLVDCAIDAGATDTLARLAVERRGVTSADERFFWLATGALVQFDAMRPDLDGVGRRHPDVIWSLRDRFTVGRRGGLRQLTVDQMAWTLSEFRGIWPYIPRPTSFGGDAHPYLATEFLLALIHQLGNDTSGAAADAMQALIEVPTDGYSEFIRHGAAEQRQKRAEAGSAPVMPAQLLAMLDNGPASNIEDLRSLVLEEIAVAQCRLRGDDTDPVRDFWTDDGKPRDENRCRDRLAEMIGPGLAHHEVLRITEADMPQGRRADLAYVCGMTMQLPMEIKGQWHDEVWDAAAGQLAARYLLHWKSEDRGIFCVLWFGDVPSASHRRLKPPPDGLPRPATPDAMRRLLIDRMPRHLRDRIAVVVIDLTAGRPVDGR